MPYGTDVLKQVNWESVFSLNQYGRKLVADRVTGFFFDDLRSPATGINPPGQASDPTINLDGGFDFSASNTNSVVIVQQLPHAYAEGTPLWPHVHWEQSGAGSVLWRLEYKIYNNGSAVPGEWTTLDSTEQVFTYTSGTIGQITPFGRIDGSGLHISAILKYRLSRIGGDASDTLAAVATLTDFDTHYMCDSSGSKREFHKDA